nr:hypothetical protein [Tanacetum cinerariifolium]
MQNPKDISNPTTALDMALKPMAKLFQLNNTTPTNNNQTSSLNPCYSQIAQSSMNTDQDRQMIMVDDNNGLSIVPGISNQNGNRNDVATRDDGNSNQINRNLIRCYNCQGEGHYVSNCTVKPRKRDAAYLQTQLQIAQKEEAGIQLNSKEFDFMAAVGISNQNGNRNDVATRDDGNSNQINRNLIRCYNCQGEGHYVSNCTVKPRKRDAAYLQTQLQIAQKEEAGIQLNSKEFDFMAAVGAYYNIEEVNANCTLKDNLQ